MDYRPLTESLPAPLPNGQQIRSFVKHCPACQARVEARHMLGIARSVAGRVFLAARATCPQCRHNFNVSCAINEDKRVKRLLLPAAFIMWWLATLHPPAAAEPPLDSTPTATGESAKQVAAEITPELSAESLGSFNGQTIPAWVDWQGRRYRFERTDAGATLHDNELRYQGLIFRRLEDKA